MLEDVVGIRSLQWHTSFTHVPEGPLLVIAQVSNLFSSFNNELNQPHSQEFFDAMPVHQFEYTER